MKSVNLPSGESLPSLGLGTWRFGESKARRSTELEALRTALELGYRLFDTAEMYAEGGAEEVLGEALDDAFRQRSLGRDDIVVVSKVYPHNASRTAVVDACDRSRRRLRLDRIDLYLLHWRGAHPIAETVAGFEFLQARGRIGRWGVSNFDVDDMEELMAVTGGASCAANQVYLSIGERGPEFALLPWHAERAMPVMAYSPIDQGALAADAGLQAVADRHGATPAQIALAWVLSRPGVVAIPKAVRAAHLSDNLAAAALELTPADHADLDRRFAPPKRKTPLAMR